MLTRLIIGLIVLKFGGRMAGNVLAHAYAAGLQNAPDHTDHNCCLDPAL